MLLIEPTWNMGALQIAGAIAALNDDEHVEKTVKAITEMREYIVEKIRKLNRFAVIGEPRSNFFLLQIEDVSLASTKMFEERLKRGVIVKDGSVSFIGLGKRPVHPSRAGRARQLAAQAVARRCRHASPN